MGSIYEEDDSMEILTDDHRSHHGVHKHRTCNAAGNAAVTRQEIELMDSYSTANARLLEEIEATDAGDCIDIGLYLLEPGKSSEMVLDALLEAGSNRGVQVTFHLDVSYVSMISRIIEKTTTLIPRAASMAARHPEWCRTRYRSKPDHSKYACFARSTQPDTAILGGMNLGDRFSDWNDFAVRVSSPHAKELRQLLLGDVASTPSPDQYEGTALTSANTAKAIAIGSPLLSLAHTLSGLALICAPVACLVAPESAPAIVAALGLGLVTTNILGAAIGTSADGAAYSLIDELSGFALSLIYDRSWLGDRLAFLRGIYPIDVPSRADWETACDTPCERRYLPLPEIFPDSVGGASNVRVVSNYRLQMRYEIEPTFRALFSEPRLTRYRVAVAYLGHRWGVELLSQALKRGASVELLMPQQANVYAEENLKAASALLETPWKGHLRIFLLPEMLHAKATVACDDLGGHAVAFLGSANLVRGSMNLPVHCGLLPYDELNVLVREPAFCHHLNESMSVLFDRAQLVRPEERDLLAYRNTQAMWEELWQ